MQLRSVLMHPSHVLESKGDSKLTLTRRRKITLVHPTEILGSSSKSWSDCEDRALDHVVTEGNVIAMDSATLQALNSVKILSHIVLMNKFLAIVISVKHKTSSLGTRLVVRARVFIPRMFLLSRTYISCLTIKRIECTRPITADAESVAAGIRNLINRWLFEMILNIGHMFVTSIKARDAPLGPLVYEILGAHDLCRPVLLYLSFNVCPGDCLDPVTSRGTDSRCRGLQEPGEVTFILYQEVNTTPPILLIHCTLLNTFLGGSEVLWRSETLAGMNTTPTILLGHKPVAVRYSGVLKHWLLSDEQHGNKSQRSARSRRQGERFYICTVGIDETWTRTKVTIRNMRGLSSCLESRHESSRFESSLDRKNRTPALNGEVKSIRTLGSPHQS
uniref:Uncharacterized protein n=1 Tax=Timema shepardi TaxID=629360 RepID=A0A7R9B3Z8_TIMSH|nr:unnamed protein product [Timema shepardi]